LALERRHKVATAWATLGALAVAGGLGGIHAAFDWNAWGISTTTMLVPALVIPVLFYLRQFTANGIPTQLLPIVAVALGVAGDYLHSLVFQGDWGVVAGVALGALADVFYTVAKELVPSQ
jgi:hypothetical protein